MQPRTPGFFWGRWHTPAPGTADDGECCDPREWAVHQVVEVSLGRDDLMAFVHGVETLQPLDAFEWGAEVPNPYA